MEFHLSADHYLAEFYLRVWLLSCGHLSPSYHLDLLCITSISHLLLHDNSRPYPSASWWLWSVGNCVILSIFPKCLYNWHQISLGTFFFIIFFHPRPPNRQLLSLFMIIWWSGPQVVSWGQGRHSPELNMSKTCPVKMGCSFFREETMGSAWMWLSTKHFRYTSLSELLNIIEN